MITLVCDNKVVADKKIIKAYGITENELNDLKESGREKGYFDYKFVTDIFRFHLLGEKKETKVVENAILFPVMTKKGTKRKYFITGMKYDKKKPPKNTYKTYLTIYGEKMEWKEFRERASLYDSFFRNNRICDATSFNINGVAVTVEREPKNILRFNVRNKKTGDEYFDIIKNEVMEITGCHLNKTSQASKFNPVVYWEDYIIERIFK